MDREEDQSVSLLRILDKVPGTRRSQPPVVQVR